MPVPRCSALRRDGQPCGALACCLDAVYCPHHARLVETHGEDALREGRYPRKRNPQSETSVVVETENDGGNPLQSRCDRTLLREGLGRPAQAEEPSVRQLPDSVEAIRAMSWHDLQGVFALQFADDIATVATGEIESVIRERLSELGEGGRALCATRWTRSRLTRLPGIPTPALPADVAGPGRGTQPARQLRASERHSMAVSGGLERLLAVTSEQPKEGRNPHGYADSGLPSGGGGI